jgi:hypothetical protein
MASTVLHEGWAILTFADGRPAHAGRLRYEQVGQMYQWVLAVPPCHRHHGFDAIIDPLYVKTITPCTEGEAVAFADAPAALREPPAA